MGVILQAAYRRGVGISVPAPVDKGAENTPWWYDHIASQANSFAKAGFTAILLPPVLKAQGGDGPGCDGYGVFDDYDIGNKNQQGSIPTRFGTREQLQRCCAVIKANNMQIYSDQVPHQRMGAGNGTYNYKGADGKTLNGRFAKIPSYFYGVDANGNLKQGYVSRDPIAGPVADDYPFGDELCPINAVPKGSVMTGLEEAGSWLTRALDLDGYRIDDTKGQAIAAVKNWINSRDIKGKFYVGEYADGNPYNLNYWVWNQGLNGQVSAFDFALHYILESMCNNTSRFDMNQLDHAGLQGISPFQTVTFVESPDTDTNGFAGIVYNKMLAYAYMLTSEGYPTVYYRDYSTDAGCYGLKAGIDNLIWIHERLAYGPTVFRHKEYQYVVYERTGGTHLLVGLNNDISNVWKTVTVQTGFGANVHLHDYTGHNGMDCWTDSQGRVTFGIPPNNNGYGYVCWAPVGVDEGFHPNHGSTTQVFEGAADLDIGPVVEGKSLTIGRIYCESETQIHIVSTITSNARFSVLDETGTLLPDNKGMHKTGVRGWYTIIGTAPLLTGASYDFDIEVTYTAPQTI